MTPWCCCWPREKKAPSEEQGPPPNAHDDAAVDPEEKQPSAMRLDENAVSFGVSGAHCDRTFVAGSKAAAHHQADHEVTRVFVAIYTTLDERDHWAIWLQDAQGNPTILQIEDDCGNRGYYVAQPVYKRPDRSARLLEALECGEIDAIHHEMAVATIQGEPVDNESETWNCQA
ncbi:hypothetical protein SELMODRAFT_410870 [Selaginella moellendorffii]|uniref:Uncharacterized protein n=1 Tax=Selaginella moellendorffii TaxID=88036 RepID=D8RG48_SELML|nr:hypothetical protein SELMODRAFT_410870 [Selaginella moellendorffii]